MIQIRDYETLLWHEVRAIDFDPKHGGFGRILFTMADGQLWEFQLCTNALKRGIDGIVIDGFQPVKTVQGCKAAVFELLYRFDKDAPLESAIRTAGILNRNCAPFDSLSPKGKKYGRLTITDKGRELNYAGKPYRFKGTARWNVVALLMSPDDPAGWGTDGGEGV